MLHEIMLLVTGMEITNKNKHYLQLNNVFVEYEGPKDKTNHDIFVQIKRIRSGVIVIPILKKMHEK